MEAQIELHDHEIPKIEEVLRILNRFKDSMNFIEFERAVQDEFAEAGYKAVCLWKMGDMEGMDAIPTEMLEFTIKVMINPPLPTPVITIVDRMTPSAFDHERQSWDVQRATLGLDQPGAIGRNGLITPPKSTAFITKKD
jgi:hypothetical protein